MKSTGNELDTRARQDRRNAVQVVRMKISIVTDAWYPQMNGVVRTYEQTGERLRALASLPEANRENLVAIVERVRGQLAG